MIYHLKYDAPIITELTDIEAFERYCKDSSSFSTRTTRHVNERVPDTYDGCTQRHHQYESVGEVTAQGDIGRLKINDVIQTLRESPPGRTLTQCITLTIRLRTTLLRAADITSG